MTTLTPIKINKNSVPGDKPIKPVKNVLNLNGSAAKPSSSHRLKKSLWLLLFLVLTEGAIIAWLYLLKPVSPYLPLLPANAIASSYFNQGSLLAFLRSQKNANPAWPPLAWGESVLKDFQQQSKVDQPEQLLALFSDQMALAILPQATDNNPTWLILASVKAAPDTFSASRDQIEQTLKQNYNLTSELYRQIKISQVQSLKDTKLSVFYAQANQYFILTNSEEVIKTTLDNIIK